MLERKYYPINEHGKGRSPGMVDGHIIEFSKSCRRYAVKAK